MKPYVLIANENLHDQSIGEARQNLLASGFFSKSIAVRRARAFREVRANNEAADQIRGQVDRIDMWITVEFV